MRNHGMPRHCRPVILLSFLASAAVGQGARGQSDNPVYVDDSQAWELFRQAQDQARDNAGEAVRLYQELLDEFGMKLIPVSEASPEHYEAVRQRVPEALQAEPALLDRYRLIQTPQAEVLLQNGELERLVATRSLTQPGMEALLRLGQRDLEAAKFQTARGWLNEAAMHIDLDTRRAAHCHFMLGLIGQYLDDPAAVADSLAMLAELGPEAEQFQVQLEQLAALNERPAMNPAITVLQRGQASDLNDLVGQAIWSVSLEESLTRRLGAAANEAEEAENDGIRARRR